VGPSGGEGTSTKLIDERPEPASAQPGPGATEPDQPRHSLRFDLIGSVWLTILLGVWLIASPLVLDYEVDDARWLPIAAGGLIALFAILRATGARSVVLQFLTMVVGAALVVGAILLADTDLARWNGIVGGALAFFLAMVAATAVTEAEATGGRTRSY
jgi:peptidoglycan/LPS O-acetylase OafA/YrhL